MVPVKGLIARSRSAVRIRRLPLLAQKEQGMTGQEAVIELEMIHDALDRALGDSDPFISEDMTEDDVRQDEPLFWACQRVAILRDAVATANARTPS